MGNLRPHHRLCNDKGARLAVAPEYLGFWQNAWAGTGFICVVGGSKFQGIRFKACSAKLGLTYR